MAPKRELDLVNRMLTSIPQRYEDQHLQMLYERGYITGLLASLAYEDSLVRDAIVKKIKELERYKEGLVNDMILLYDSYANLNNFIEEEVNKYILK